MASQYVVNGTTVTIEESPDGSASTVILDDGNPETHEAVTTLPASVADRFRRVLSANRAVRV